MEGKVPQQQRHEQWPGRRTAVMTTHADGRLPGVSAQQWRPSDARMTPAAARGTSVGCLLYTSPSPRDAHES
eukprot:5009155-Prymnesium_polylepis.1